MYAPRADPALARPAPLVAALAWLALAGCVTYTKPIPTARSTPVFHATPMTFSNQARQARLATLVLDVPTGHRYGESAWGLDGFCFRKSDLVNTEGRIELDTKRYADVFVQTMKRLGYPVEEDTALFKDTKDRVADLLVAGRIVDATLNECYPRANDSKLKATGTAYLKIEWSVYSPVEKKVLGVFQTDGTTYQEIASDIGQPGLLRPALQDAVEKLAALHGYQRLIDPPASESPAARAAAPAPGVAPAAAPAAAPVVAVPAAAPPARAAAPAVGAKTFRIKAAAPFSGDLKANLERVREAVLTVNANAGSGSGFVLSADGKALTAEHVVSGTRFVKVRTGTGRECWGEVVASSKARDLALIELQCTGLVPLPLARRKVVEGGEVYAVGTPLDDTLEFTVTKGVVSGIRKYQKLDYIQSDVNVLHGNSGGPLLDSAGNVLGIATKSITSSGVPLGVNLFVPLGDLEQHLPLVFE